MKKSIQILIFFTVFCLLIMPRLAFANAAQPGVWNAGGTVFTMLYPEDSLTFKKVQMQQEQIFMQLYKGYAVVKGVYHFRNTTAESLSFRMGYPVNGIYNGGQNDLNEVTLDSLSQFKIKTNNQWLPLLSQTHEEHGNIMAFSENWKVWEMSFAPNETQTVEVYFLVNTNNAQVRKGYNVDKKNAFIYLLESGSVWHQPIEDGRFFVQLKDDLMPEDINGISDGFDFRYNDIHKIYAGYKTHFSPTPADNLVITYHENNEGFAFEKIIRQSEVLFQQIDQTSNQPMNDLVFENISLGDPYEVQATFGGALPGLILTAGVLLPVVAGVIILIFVVWKIVKWFKKRQK